MSDSSTNTNMAAPGTYYRVDGEPSIALKDLSIENASFNGLISFVTNRKADILKEANMDERPHFTVSREAGSIKFTMYEHGGSKPVGGEYTPNMTMTASVKATKDHNLVMGWMARDNWDAQELGQLLKRHMHLFASDAQYNSTVRTLTTMRVEIGTVVEDVKKDEGEKKKLLEQKLSGQPDIKFAFKYAMFVGQPEVTVDVTVLYDIDGSDVTLALFSATLERTKRDTQKALLENTVAALKEVLGDKVAFIELNA
jgi:hypothetical protein